MKKSKKILLSVGLLALLCCGVYFFALTPGEVEVPIKEYVANQDKARKEADNARKEWENSGEERKRAEKEQLENMSIPDLSKRAVDVLVRAENPQFIVNKAIETTRRKSNASIVVPPWGKTTDPDKNVFWSIVYRKEMDKDHDWWIEQNNVFGQYRLVGSPGQFVYFSINDEEKLCTVLSWIVIFGDQRPFFQVGSVGVDNAKPGCVAISLENAARIFPETVNLAEGIYAKHPYNLYALVPLMDFHSILAMDKVTESIVLLGRMGAKTVKVSRTDGENSEIAGGLKVSFPGKNTAVNAELARGINSKMCFLVRFSGGVRDDISPELLRNSCWHKSDAQMNGILELILSGNKPKEWRFTEENQSDFNFDFKTAAGILGVVDAELRAKFEKVRQTVREFHVTF